MQRYAAGVSTKCLYQFDEPVSPHIAAKQKNLTVCSCSVLPVCQADHE